MLGSHDGICSVTNLVRLSLSHSSRASSRSLSASACAFHCLHHIGCILHCLGFHPAGGLLTLLGLCLGGLLHLVLQDSFDASDRTAGSFFFSEVIEVHRAEWNSVSVCPPQVRDAPSVEVSHVLDLVLVRVLVRVLDPRYVPPRILASPFLNEDPCGLSAAVSLPDIVLCLQLTMLLMFFFTCSSRSWVCSLCSSARVCPCSWECSFHPLWVRSSVIHHDVLDL